MIMSDELADFSSEPVEGLVAEPVKIPLFSQVGHNMWMGGAPTTEIPPVEFIVCLYPWQEYTVPEGITITKAWLYDYHEIPDVRQIVALARWTSAVRKIGPVLCHCQAGLNRSGLVVALAMMIDGASADYAIRHLRSARSEYVLCNSTFAEWLRNSGAEALKIHE